MKKVFFGRLLDLRYFIFDFLAGIVLGDGGRLIGGCLVGDGTGMW